MNWIQTNERLPDKPGVYIVTILNREWVGPSIEEGAIPEHDEYWDDHSNTYGQLPDGRWVMTGQRVFHDGVWSGYQETVLAWMEMPDPFGVNKQLALF